MKPLLKVMLFLAAAFALTFIIGRSLGILTVENVKHWLELAGAVDPVWLAGTVVLLLFLDLFVAVPTLTITLLGGYFLGFPVGAAAAFTGVSLAAICGHGISRIWGERAVSFLLRDDNDRKDMAQAFQRNGPAMIILSRAVPIVPEVTACMAGATNMRFAHYLGYFSLSTLPYVLIASYAGSISSPESPQPAIYAALALYAVLWIGWYLFRRTARRSLAN